MRQLEVDSIFCGRNPQSELRGQLAGRSRGWPRRRSGRGRPGCARHCSTSRAPWWCSLSRVRDAHAARVWLPLGHASWASYCEAEFGISRAQVSRLLDVARALAAIHGAVAAGTDLSRT
ncbi:hypothetical protein [Streptomyces sp. NPDC101150]|uniref:hypothetical protein n=1 Tax=Streptomyces sp. NPDC101150 TaxID=3366114 RepID=UPI003805C3B8